MANPVDSLDEQILAALQENGRLTMKSLAEQVGLSSPAMIERVRRLEERGVIAGYRAVVSPEALGRPITAIIAATVGPNDRDEFMARVGAHSAVAEVLRITGGATHLVRVHVAGMAMLQALVDELTGSGAHCETTIVLSSPVPYRAITPPEGTTVQRSRLTRRRRRASADGAGDGETPKRPGRPRGRKAARAAAEATEKAARTEADESE
ncbi:MAG: Lrp/AsnC family transcriptional regulator [Thermomicrobiales bacterium]